MLLTGRQRSFRTATVATPHARRRSFAAMEAAPGRRRGISARPSLRPERVESRKNGLFVSFGPDAPPIAEIFVEGQETVAFKAPEFEGGFFMQEVCMDFGAAPVVLTIRRRRRGGDPGHRLHLAGTKT